MLIAFVELGVEPLSEERILLIAAMALLILILIIQAIYKMANSCGCCDKQSDQVIIENEPHPI